MTISGDKEKEVVIWNISMSGNSFFIVDFWKVSNFDEPEPVGQIAASRIVVSSCTILEMSYSNKGKVKVIDYSITPIDEPGVAHKFLLTIRTEEGSIVVRGVHAVELVGPPVLPM
jgi:hypothetical protein